MGKRVEIHGAARANMNDKRGVAIDFHWYEDESKWRYAVKLDSGAAVSDELSSMLLADGSCPIGLTDEEQLVGSALHPV